MAHDHLHGGRDSDQRALKVALGLILAYMAGEVVAGLFASSLALLSDAAHMLTDAAALALSLATARIAARPVRGAMTFGLGRAEILSAQVNGITLLVLALLILYDGVRRLIEPARVTGSVVLVVALVGVAVNLVAARTLAAGSARGAPGRRGAARGLNVEGAYRHILTDLYAFVATAAAGVAILTTGFSRADPIASLLIAALMLHAAVGLLIASGRVFMEAAPAGLDPVTIGRALVAQAGVVEVHDLHVWEVTSGFPALSAHVLVRAGEDCHERRRALARLLRERFEIEHTTLQVDHEGARQAPLQIEVAPLDSQP